jgi:hypothetical protein
MHKLQILIQLKTAFGQIIAEILELKNDMRRKDFHYNFQRKNDFIANK